MVDESDCCEANKPNCGAFIKTTTLTPTICRQASRTVFFFLNGGRSFSTMGRNKKDEHGVRKYYDDLTCPHPPTKREQSDQYSYLPRSLQSVKKASELTSAEAHDQERYKQWPCHSLKKEKQDHIRS